MQRLLEVFADDALLVELTISLVGLSFMCALTYAMRWLPVKDGEPEDEEIHAESPSFVMGLTEMELLSASETAVPIVRNEKKTALTIAD